MRELRVLLIGQPNVGKSALLNALVGPRVVVSDYPGTTVEITKAQKTFEGTRISIVDTPGMYSISDRSEEEKIAERALFEEESSIAVVVADTCALERSLYLALQVLEAGIPALIALNFWEEAEKKGITVDMTKLEAILGVPVIPINPVRKQGLDQLLRALVRLETPDLFQFKYDDHVEQAIDRLSDHMEEDHLPKRFVAIRLLEGDDDFLHYLQDEDAISEVREGLREHPRVEEDVSITRYGTASLIAEKSTRIAHVTARKEVSLQDRIDNILFHRFWGVLATWGFSAALFGLLLYVGNAIQELLMNLTEGLLVPLGPGEGSIIAMVAVQALTGVAAGVSIALPYVFLFYIVLGLLEDVGLLTRFVVNMERFLKRLGLPGRAFIPLALSLGCTVPAVRATRVLASTRSKLYTATLFAFVPCSSRIAIIMGIVGYYGGTMLALGVLGTSLIAGLLWALVVERLIGVAREPLLLELPPYRRPAVGSILTKSWIRMKDFVYIVIPLLAVGGMLYGILERFHVTPAVVTPFSPITQWLDLPSHTIVPLLFGFLQKDLTGAMLVSVLGSDIPSALTSLQLYTFGVAATIGIPCVIALGMLARELGCKTAFVLLFGSFAYGILFAGVARRVISLFM